MARGWARAESQRFSGQKPEPDALLDRHYADTGAPQRQQASPDEH